MSRNFKTERFTGEQLLPSPDLKEAYGFARNLAKMQMQAPMARGHRVVWVRQNTSHAITLPAEGFVIAGRHTQCSFVLPEDPFIALRHLLIRSIALPSGGVALRLLDLHSDIGFRLVDGSKQSSIFCEGPVAVALSSCALIALPSETPDDLLPNELPEASIAAQLAAVQQAMSPYRQNARLNRHSRITLMPKLVMIGEVAPPRLGRLASGGQWIVTLENNGRSASQTVSEDDLLGGIVIGRSDKCLSETLRRITATGTSRVHVLLLREGSDVVAYDLASTQGTFDGQMHVRRCILPETGKVLTLGVGSSAVKLYWQRV